MPYCVMISVWVDDQSPNARVRTTKHDLVAVTPERFPEQTKQTIANLACRVTTAELEPEDRDKITDCLIDIFKAELHLDVVKLLDFKTQFSRTEWLRKHANELWNIYVVRDADGKASSTVYAVLGPIEDLSLAKKVDTPFR